MNDFILVMIGGVMYSLTMLYCIHFLYRKKVTFKTIFVFLLLLSLFIEISKLQYVDMFKELLLGIVIVVILISIYSVPYYSSGLFLFPLLFKFCLYYPIDWIFNLSIIQFVSLLERDYAIDVVYSVYVYRNLLLFLFYYMTNNILVFDDDLLNAELALFLTFGFAVIPFLILFLIRHSYKEDLKMEELEKKLSQVTEDYYLMYRYSHNMSSLLVTINLLAKEKNKWKMMKYLETFHK